MNMQAKETKSQDASKRAAAKLLKKLVANFDKMPDFPCRGEDVAKVLHERATFSAPLSALILDYANMPRSMMLSVTSMRYHHGSGQRPTTLLTYEDVSDKATLRTIAEQEMMNGLVLSCIAIGVPSIRPVRPIAEMKLFLMPANDGDPMHVPIPVWVILGTAPLPGGNSYRTSNYLVAPPWMGIHYRERVMRHLHFLPLSAVELLCRSCGISFV
jgi:hypothetical protein